MQKNCRPWVFNLLPVSITTFQTENNLVNINGTESDPLPITCGVPQGSILGPLLFLCYVSDMPYSVNCLMLQYADDSALTCLDKDPEKIGRIPRTNLESCIKVVN